MITKLRASKISIEKPRENSETWVHITVQQVIKDDNENVINIIPRYDYISIPLKEFGTVVYTGKDPITQDDINASGYGIASLISSVILNKMLDKYGGKITPQGDLIT